MCVWEGLGEGGLQLSSEEEKVCGGEGGRYVLPRPSRKAGMEDRKDFFKALWGPTFVHPKNKGN